MEGISKVLLKNEHFLTPVVEVKHYEVFSIRICLIISIETLLRFFAAA
jgi:hypothetical protein